MSAVPLESENDRPSSSEAEGPNLRVITSRRVAVVLFNLGGPDSLKAVQPFLFNLFNDKAIIGLPQPFRFLLANLISRTRNKSAQANYALMGGRSPLLPETEKQAIALQDALNKAMPHATFQCFPAMRYWRPFAKQVARAAEKWGATDVLLLPLYPQFSSTTTGSSLKAWRRVSDLKATTLCCYPTDDAFAQAHADAIMEAWRAGGSPPKPRVLFSAHGLPQSVIERGDPYEWQIQQSVAAVRAKLPADWQHRLCYQSRVGPMKWLGPSTEQEIHNAIADNQGVIVSPIAFVSEHVETLVELDIEYGQAAKAQGIPYYLRAGALSDSPRFIAALAELAARALEQPGKVASQTGGRICPAACGLCAQAE